MSTPFQNRLVGTVIIAAAAVIFLPDILGGKQQQSQTVFEDIPATPAIEATPKATVFPENKLALTPNEKIDKTATLRKVFDEQSDNILSTNETDKVKVSPVEKTVSPNQEQQVVSENKMKPKQLAEVFDKKATPPIQQWVIQLGSYSQQKNVDELVKLLTDNDFNAFTKPIKTKMGMLTKVFVGPATSKKTLESKLSALQKLTKVNGKVSTYKP